VYVDDIVITWGNTGKIS